MAAAPKQSLTPAQWRSVTDHLIELGQRMTQATSRPTQPESEKVKTAAERKNTPR
jgi:hypothetical protein